MSYEELTSTFVYDARYIGAQSTHVEHGLNGGSHTRIYQEPNT